MKLCVIAVLSLAAAMFYGADSIIDNGDFSRGLDRWELAGTNLDRCISIADENINGVLLKALRYKKTADIPADNFHVDQNVTLAADASYTLTLRYRSDGALKPVLAFTTFQFKHIRTFALTASKSWTNFSVTFTGAPGEKVKFQIFPGARGRTREAYDGESFFTAITLIRSADAVKTAPASVPVPEDVRPAADASVVITEGWDWSLPKSAKPAEYSGFTTWGKSRFSPLITVRGGFIPWKSVSPQDGVYDFSPLLEAIASNKAAGMRTGIHLMNVERQYIPDWIMTKYNPPVIDVIPLKSNQPWKLKIVPPWHADVLREYEKLMTEFAKTGIPKRDDVVYAYMNGVSASRGEELFLRREDAAQWEQEAGLTPAVYSNCLIRRMDAFMQGFTGVEYKLAWMNPDDTVTGVPGYREATAGLAGRAISRGTGYRGGGIDFQTSLIASEGAGSSVNDDGYNIIDENNPVIRERRIRGDENEEYGRGWEWRFGPVAGHEYRHRICTLRSLQMRQNFVMVSPDTLKISPALNEYTALEMGQDAATSPDAWAYLRECSTRSLTVKNIERWLIQRDVPGAMTAACERIDRAPIPSDADGKNFDYDARRTDIANGQRFIALQLYERFWEKPQPATVKVTYLDTGSAVWRIDYAAAGDIAVTPSVTNTGSGARRTATFDVPLLAASRAFGGMDFRIAALGTDDITAAMVRVIKKR